MKKIALILSALAVSYSAQAQDATKPAYSVTVDFPYTSKYVFRGIEYARDSIQPSVELAAGNFYAGIWTSQPIVDNTDNEFDFYAGYGLPLNETWKVDFGGTFYYYPEYDKSLGGESHTFEGYVGLTGSVSGFTPGVYAYYDFDLEAWTYQASVGYSVPLEAAGTSLDFTATYGLVSPDEGDDYNYWGLGVNVPYKLTEKATATVGVQYATNDVDVLEGDHLYFTAGITVGF